MEAKICESKLKDTLEFQINPDVFTWHKFANFLPENSRNDFLWKNEDRRFRIGIYLNDQPGGISWGVINSEDENPDAFIDHLYVSPAFRSHGVGTALLQATLDYVRDRGAEKVQIEHRTDTQEGRKFGQFLDRFGFSPPEFNQLEIEITPAGLKKTRWFHPYTLPSEFEIISWSKISQSDREQLKRADWVPDILNPLKIEKYTDELSVVIKQKNDPVGWVILLDEDGQVTCPTAYIHPKFQPRGRILPVYYYTLSRAIQRGMKLLKYSVPVQFSSHIQFMKKHTKPYAKSFLPIDNRVLKLE